MVLTEANLLSARGGQHAGLVPTPEPDLFCLDAALLPPLRPSGQRLSCFPKALLGGKCLEVRLTLTSECLPGSGMCHLPPHSHDKGQRDVPASEPGGFACQWQLGPSQVPSGLW